MRRGAWSVVFGKINIGRDLPGAPQHAWSSWLSASAVSYEGCVAGQNSAAISGPFGTAFA